MEIRGDTRVYLVINTPEYNGDHKWGAQDSSLNGLLDLGFDDDDIRIIDKLEVGQSLSGFDFKGVIVIRVA